LHWFPIHTLHLNPGAFADTQRYRESSPVKMKAEIEVMWPQTKDGNYHRELEEGRTIFPRGSRSHQP
jgi:hypothetical protein